MSIIAILELLVALAAGFGGGLWFGHRNPVKVQIVAERIEEVEREAINVFTDKAIAELKKLRK